MNYRVKISVLALSLGTIISANAQPGMLERLSGWLGFSTAKKTTSKKQQEEFKPRYDYNTTPPLISYKADVVRRDSVPATPLQYHLALKYHNTNPYVLLNDILNAERKRARARVPSRNEIRTFEAMGNF